MLAFIPQKTEVNCSKYRMRSLLLLIEAIAPHLSGVLGLWLAIALRDQGVTGDTQAKTVNR